MASCGGRCWSTAGRYSLSTGDSWQEWVCELTSGIVTPKPFLSTPLNPELKVNECWFALNLVVRKGIECLSLVMSVGWGIWGEWCLGFFVLIF